jgi:hypothetical protein
MHRPQLERIRLLSARFHELQGLRVALAGAAITLGVGAYLFAAPEPTNNGALAALVVSFIPVLPGVRWLNRYYAATFGRQVFNPKPLLRPALFLLGYAMIGTVLNATIPAVPAGAPTIAVVAIVSLWVALRDWPWRAYYLIVPAALALAFFATPSGGGALASDLRLVAIFLALGLAMVAIGLLDHLLLVKLTKESRAVAGAAAEADDAAVTRREE